jgi:hypothetical protein
VDSKSLLHMPGKCHFCVQTLGYKHKCSNSHFLVQQPNFPHMHRNDCHRAAHWAASLPQQDIQNMEQTH